MKRTLLALVLLLVTFAVLGCANTKGGQAQYSLPSMSEIGKLKPKEIAAVYMKALYRKDWARVKACFPEELAPQLFDEKGALRKEIAVPQDENIKFRDDMIAGHAPNPNFATDVVVTVQDETERLWGLEIVKKTKTSPAQIVLVQMVGQMPVVSNVDYVTYDGRVYARTSNTWKSEEDVNAGITVRKASFTGSYVKGLKVYTTVGPLSDPLSAILLKMPNGSFTLYRLNDPAAKPEFS